jgi:hypothetical protein
MGTCSSLIRPNPQALLSKSLHTYPRVCTVHIKSKDLPSSTNAPFNFILTDPIQLSLEPIFVGSVEVVATQCILPGIDPRGEYFKKCQDHTLILHTNDSLFLGLFDGHGIEGNDVVQFCSLYAERYFFSMWKEPYVLFIQPDVERFLVELTETCNAELAKAANRIDSSYSGT